MDQQASPVLKAGLLLGCIITLVYGLIFFLIPNQFVAFSGGDPVAAAWLRWPGGMLIAVAVSNGLVYRSPARQGIWVIFGMLSFALVGLALLFSWLTGEYTVDTVNIAFPALLDLIMAVVLYLGWQSSQELLKWR